MISTTANRAPSKNNCFDKQNNNSSARPSHFLVHFIDVHCTTSNATFYAVREHTTKKIPFPAWKFSVHEFCFLSPLVCRIFFSEAQAMYDFFFPQTSSFVTIYVRHHNTVKPLWSGHVRDLPKCPLNSGAPTRASRAWDRAPYSFGCHVIDRAYASTDCTGGVGETIKRKGGVSQACLGKSTSFILDIHNMVNWQLSKQDSHWPLSHDHIASSCVNSSRWRDLFESCPLTN